MTVDEFAAQARAWADEVVEEARALFDAGLPPERCLNIAIQIRDGKEIARTRRRSALAMPNGAGRPT